MGVITMTDIATRFFHHASWDQAKVETIVAKALATADDGELFLEYAEIEYFAFDDKRLRSASFDTSTGFGLRGVVGETTAYAHASEMSEAALERAATSLAALPSDVSTRVAMETFAVHPPLYMSNNPVHEGEFAAKCQLLADIDQYARSKHPAVRQVSASLAGSWQAVMILRADGQWVQDVRPLVRLNVSIHVEHNGRMESGSHGIGGRKPYAEFIAPASWQHCADEALRQALVKLDSVPTPAGEMTVVLGSGWPGVLLHEAVGHGLEGDFNRKGTSAFSNRIGERVASPGVTVLDDGTIADRRGSITIDDEGTPSAKTTLIEDGILVGYIHDRLNARLMGHRPTGNGRREDYSCVPMPRMTNTYMLAGKDNPADLIASVKNGIYAPMFGGGQVDITSGKFVFTASEAYKIENGKITQPLKDATLIGNGPDILTRVVGIGNDMQLDPGIGTCGKSGQSVPVGVGQPTLLIDKMTIGGTSI
jgi:TldD protein